MSDPRFERELHRMFAEAPPRPDAELFAARVRERLERTWAWRPWLIGIAGLGGGMAAVAQLAGSQAFARLEEVVATPLGDLWRSSGLLADAAPVLRAVPIPAEMVWLVGGLMLLAAGLVVTRVVDEL